MTSVEIYALCDPRTGDVRYIGKANNAAKRLASHLRDARRRNTPVYSWIKKLSSIGLAPFVRVISTVREDAWRDEEIRQISFYRNQGELLNIADGGDQPYCPPEARRRGAAGMNAAVANLGPNQRKLVEMKRSVGRTLYSFRRYGPVERYAELSLRCQYLAFLRPESFACWENAGMEMGEIVDALGYEKVAELIDEWREKIAARFGAPQ